MKILLFTKEYNHPKVGHSGGTGVFYRNLAQELRARNHDVYVFGSCKKAIQFVEDGIQHYFVQHYFKKNKFAEFLRSSAGKINFLKETQTQFYEDENKYLVDQLEEFINKENLKIDVIETHDWDGTSLFLNRLNIPYTVRYHGSWTILQKYFGYKKVAFGKIQCEKKAATNSKNNICISQFSKRINTETFGLKNTHLIYNGIDYNYYKPEDTSERIPKSIFYLGNVSAEKGADIALAAFEKIKKQITEATLHFIGNSNGYEKDENKDVIFYGRKNSNEIKSLLDQAEIALFPSKGENFSLSLLEVMAMKRAVICSSIESFKEIIIDNENGMIAENADEFAEKAILLLKNKELRNQLEENARRTVINRFGIEKQMEETIKFYQKIYEEHE